MTLPKLTVKQFEEKLENGAIVTGHCIVAGSEYVRASDSNGLGVWYRVGARGKAKT